MTAHQTCLDERPHATATTKSASNETTKPEFLDATTNAFLECESNRCLDISTSSRHPLPIQVKRDRLLSGEHPSLMAWS